MVYRLVQNAKLALQRKHTNHQFISVYIKDFDNKLKALDCKTIIGRTYSYIIVSREIYLHCWYRLLQFSKRKLISVYFDNKDIPREMVCPSTMGRNI